MKESVVSVFVDGGTVARNPSVIAGTWAWCRVNVHDERVINASGVLPAGEWPEGKVTNNQAEYVALVFALAALPAGWSGQICSDSEVTLGRFLLGWKLKNIPEAWVQRANRAKRRLGPLTAVFLGGHPTLAQLTAGAGAKGQPVSRHQVWCDEQCQREGDRFHQRLRGLPS